MGKPGQEKEKKKKRRGKQLDKVTITNVHFLPTRVVYTHKTRRSRWTGMHSGGHGRRPHPVKYGESRFPQPKLSREEKRAMEEEKRKGALPKVVGWFEKGKKKKSSRCAKAEK